jgi:CBS domain-containing protein
MKCEDLMTPLPTCCQANHSLSDVAQMMKRDDVGAVPVVKGDALELVGLVTDRDIVVKAIADGLDPVQTTVETVMSTRLVSCSRDDAVETALDLMTTNQIRRIPVVNDRYEVVGIIAQADVATRLGDPDETAQVVEAISKDEAANPRLHSV